MPKTVEPVIIQPIDTAIFYLDLNDFKDTIAISYSAYFNYNFSIGNRSIYIINVILNDEIIGTFNSINGSFFLDTRDLSTGNYELLIEIYTNSGSQSLADKVGAEVLYAQFNYIVTIDKNLPEPIIIDEIKNDDGILKISWRKCASTNCTKYRIMRGSEKVLADIHDLGITCFYDSTYVGGAATYSIQAHAYDGRYTNGQPYTINYPIPTITEFEIESSGKFIADNTYRLTWTPCLFDRAFSAYEVLQKTCYPINRIYNYDVNETFAILENLQFGCEIRIMIQTFPQNSTPLPMKEEKTYFLGEITKKYEYGVYHEQSNTSYFINDDIINAANISQDTVSLKINGLLGIQLTNKYLYAFTKDRVLELGLTDLSVINEFSKEVYYPTEKDFVSPSISENRIMIVGIGYYHTADNKGAKKFLLLNLEDKTIVEFDRVYYHDDVQISPDGNFIRFNRMVYRIEQNKLIEIGYPPNSDANYTKFVDDNRLLVVETLQGEKSKLSIYNNIDLQLLDELFFDYDYNWNQHVPLTSKIILTSDNMSYPHVAVLDFDSKNVVNELFCRERSFVVGNFFYTQNGYKIEFQ